MRGLLFGFVCLLIVCTACADPPQANASSMPTPAATLAPIIGNQPLSRCASATAGAMPVTVALNGASQPAVTALSTNVAAITNLEPQDGALPHAAWDMLRQWNPPMVRLHFGFYGGAGPSLPEAQPGSWDFTQLDALIGQLRAQGISFYLEVRTAPPWMFNAIGQLRDPTFQEFATYMARLVGWYNKGGFTDEAGHFHASGHSGWVHTWEVWNEPNSSFEIPAPVPSRPATWLAPERFAQLYDTAAQAMRRVDPAIAIGGPAISSYPDIPYLQNFVHNVHEPLNFLAFHFYAIGDAQTPDQDIFNAVYGPRFADRLNAAHQILATEKPGQAIPIWIDEVGVNEVSHLPSDPRGTSPLAYAFISEVFALASTQQVALLVQFPLVGTNQLALLDEQSHQIYRPFWFYELLARAFPPGAALVPLATPAGSGLVGLAAIAPDGQSLRLLVANSRVAHATDVGGTGVPTPVHLTMIGRWQGTTIPPGATATAWAFDAAASDKGLPAPCAIGVTVNGAAPPAFNVVIGGYGAMIIDLPLGTGGLQG